MIYPKNVLGVERVVRVAGGAALIACGLIGMRGLPPLFGYAVAAAGVASVLTGFIGFCPMCALAGRRIRRNLEGRKAPVRGDAP